MGKFKAFFYGFILLVFALVLLGFRSPSATKAQENPNANLHRPVCIPQGNDTPRCHAHVVVDRGGKPQATTSPTGYGPAQFLGAYNLTGSTSGNIILAIVDAFDDPTIQQDLDTYSAMYHIPSLATCSGSIAASVGPCFQKVDQRGGLINYPAVDSGWALEIALDVQTAHAVCQNCKILLVEADSNTYSNLMAAVDEAQALGATVISNSYGSNEFSGETTFDSHFKKLGVAFTFSSGDSGYGSSYPAASRYVTAVGGTTLNVSGTSYVSESVWSGSGSGCSTYESKQLWQTDTGCSRRTIADVSADADPNTGASVYTTTPYAGQTGWFQVGGTSLSSPIIAATYALSGGVGPTVQANSVPYAQFNYATNFHDVVSGRNGNCRRFSLYLCTGVVGYDGPTGLGTPKGINGF